MSTYKLKYNDYFTNVSDGLRSMLASEDITDVTLAVDGRFFKAHQMILSIFSSYFRELFIANPCRHPIFFLKDVKYQIMKDLLTFMYEGMVQIEEENFNLFVDTAKALQVKGLTNIEEMPTFEDTKFDAAEDSRTNHTKEPIKVPNTDKGLKRVHDFQKAMPLDDLQVMVHEEEVQVAPVIKKSKGVNPMPVPSLSEVTVLPLPGSSASWKSDTYDKGLEQIDNVAEMKADVINANIQNIISNESNKYKGVHRIIIDAEAQFQVPMDTIDLDDDLDECDIKPEDEYSADNSQDDLEILGEGTVEGEPVIVTFVQSRKGRSLIVNNYRYCIGDQSNYWTTWRCTRRRTQNQESCRAVVCLTRDNRVVLKNAHNHEAPAPDNHNGALVVQQRTCRSTTMMHLNKWRCDMQQAKVDL